MLKISLNKETGVLAVREAQHSFRGTKRSYWYYDLQKRLKSSHGREGDTPDRPMSDADVAWVTMHYLPKVEPTDAAPAAGTVAFADPATFAKPMHGFSTVGELRAYLADLQDDLPVCRQTEGYHQINKVGEVYGFVDVMKEGHQGPSRLMLRITA